MMTLLDAVAWDIALLALLAYSAKGITGAGSAIVFNAGFLIILVLGCDTGHALVDILYVGALADVVFSALMAWRLRSTLRWDPLVLRLIAGSFPVLLTCTFLIERIEPGTLTVLLSVALIGAGLYQLGAGSVKTSSRGPARWALPVGAAAGLVGGLFGMGGPFYFLVLLADSHDPSLFRRRMVLVSSTMGAVRLVALSVSGVYTTERLLWAGQALTFGTVGLVVGMALHAHVAPKPFRVGLGIAIVIAGLCGLYA